MFAGRAWYSAAGWPPDAREGAGSAIDRAPCSLRLVRVRRGCDMRRQPGRVHRCFADSEFCAGQV